MLSYMLPAVEEKPPLAPHQKGHLQLLINPESMSNGKHANSISKENSISSFLSDGTTTTISQNSMTPTSCCEKSKPKLAINGTKPQQPLKRVSFGSSKGSMVETLIYENRVQDDGEASPIAEYPTPIPNGPEKNETEREKVRVTFFQQSKPQEVDLLTEPPLFCSNQMIMESTPVNEVHHTTTYTVHQSIENGWDNPFRPGGNLSKEADEIVELIKGGKPITPTSGTAPSPTLLDESDAKFNNSRAYAPITESPKKATATSLNATPQSANGNVKNDKIASPAAVDIQRGTVLPAGDASQVEHVVIKKKPKCKCCVIQ